jgi:hypothetical protein
MLTLCAPPAIPIAQPAPAQPSLSAPSARVASSAIPLTALALGAWRTAPLALGQHILPAVSALTATSWMLPAPLAKLARRVQPAPTRPPPAARTTTTHALAALSTAAPAPAQPSVIALLARTGSTSVHPAALPALATARPAPARTTLTAPTASRALRSLMTPRLARPAQPAAPAMLCAHSDSVAVTTCPLACHATRLMATPAFTNHRQRGCHLTRAAVACKPTIPPSASVRDMT